MQGKMVSLWQSFGRGEVASCKNETLKISSKVGEMGACHIRVGKMGVDKMGVGKYI